MKAEMSRRHLLRGLVLGACAGLWAKGLFGAQQVWAAAKKELIDMSQKKRKDKVNEDAVKIAKGLNYHEDAAAADKKGEIKRVEKPGPGGKMVKGSEQTCGNCNFYKEVEKGKSGECQLIAGVLVHHKGWCNSWMANMKAPVAK